MDSESRRFIRSRRNVLAGLAAAPLAASSIRPAFAQAQAGPSWTPQETQAALKDAKGTKLVLLGTAAGPVPGRSRQMTSHVMLSNGSAYVLDCGMGVTNQYARTGIPFAALKSIFITHHHADHNIEYGPLLTVGWIQGMRPKGVQAFGPPPLKQMTDDREPLRRVHEQQLGTALFDLTPKLFVASFERSPALVLLRREENVGLAGNYVGFLDD